MNERTGGEARDRNTSQRRERPSPTERTVGKQVYPNSDLDARWRFHDVVWVYTLSYSVAGERTATERRRRPDRVTHRDERRAADLFSQSDTRSTKLVKMTVRGISKAVEIPCTLVRSSIG